MSGNSRNYDKFISDLFELIEFKQIISYGCGIGILECILARYDKSVICIDSDDVNFMYVHKLLKPPKNLDFQVIDFLKVDPESTDLAICTEVATYYEDDTILPFLEKLCSSCKHLYFSASPTRSAAFGEVNFKEPLEWQEIIEGFGMSLTAKMGFPNASGMLFSL